MKERNIFFRKKVIVLTLANKKIISWYRMKYWFSVFCL